MDVEIHEAGGNDEPAGIQGFGGVADELGAWSKFGNAAVAEEEVEFGVGVGSRVNDASPADKKGIGRSFLSLLRALMGSGLWFLGQVRFVPTIKVPQRLKPVHYLVGDSQG
jgi:hypothetical protein